MFIDSLRTQWGPTPDGRFAVLKDGRVIATFETQQEAEEHAWRESQRVEQW